MDLHKLTATEALSRFKAGSLKVEQYARGLLSHIAERDAAVKAWAYLDDDYVITQAKRLDRVPLDQRGPLHGVPVAIKDIIYTKDMPTCFNSPIYTGNNPKIDAACVTILRHAGALIFGKTTTAEFAAVNKGPVTRNPHDPQRTPGGSSSGSGAAVGDFQVPIALGTQTGGSMIRPASFNGIYGFKPTWNAVSREGAKIYSLLYDTIGFYARSVEDLDLLADIFALKDDKPVQPLVIKGSKFGLVKSWAWSQAGPGTRAAMENAKSILQSHGAEVDEIDLPSEFNDDFVLWQRIWLASEGRTSFLSEYRIAKGELDTFLIDHVENKEGYSRAQQVNAFDNLAMLRPKMEKIMEPYVAILTPSATDEAPLGIERTGSSAFNLMWTALHMPVINIPAFKSEKGLPVGVSLVAPRYHDRHLLETAKVVGGLLIDRNH